MERKKHNKDLRRHRHFSVFLDRLSGLGYTKYIIQNTKI